MKKRKALQYSHSLGLGLRRRPYPRTHRKKETQQRPAVEYPWRGIFLRQILGKHILRLFRQFITIDSIRIDKSYPGHTSAMTATNKTKILFIIMTPGHYTPDRMITKSRPQSCRLFTTLFFLFQKTEHRFGISQLRHRHTALHIIGFAVGELSGFF